MSIEDRIRLMLRGSLILNSVKNKISPLVERMLFKLLIS